MSEVSVKNFDEMRLAMKKELKILSDKLAKSLKAAQSMNPDIGAYEIMKIENLQSVLSQMVAMYDHVLSQINLSPNITINPEFEIPEIKLPEIQIPEIRLPNINVPEAKVTVNNEFDVERLIRALEPLKNISRNPTSPLAVRLSDGKKFVEALKKASEDISSSAEKMGVVFSGGNSGASSDDMRALGLGTARSVVGGNKTVTTAGTRVQLSSSSLPCRWLIIVGKEANTDTIWVGGPSVANGTGIPLLALQSERLDINDVSNVWIDSEVNGEGVTFVYGN